MKPLLSIAALGGVCLLAGSAFAQTWTQTSAPFTNWTAVACSADGSKLAAAANPGLIYTSPDSGTTWTPTSAPATNWTTVASSADGRKLVAAVAVYSNGLYATGGPIYVSADAGTTWSVTSAPETNWASVASSADGSKLVAVTGGAIPFISGGPSGPIYTSTDSGVTWAATSVSNANCTSVVSSSDGSKLLAVSASGGYFSSDSGATWQARPVFYYAVSVAASADGSRLVGGNADPFHPPFAPGSFTIYVSTNCGVTWQATPASGRGRGLVASSADGTRLVAAVGGNSFGISGPIFVSMDSGATWTENGSPSTNWSSVASSADGGKLVAVAKGGGIWTAQFAVTPLLSIAPSGSTLVLSWTVPSLSFVLQENSALTTTHWTDVPGTPALNLTNLQDQLTMPLSTGNRFYRLQY